VTTREQELEDQLLAAKTKILNLEAQALKQAQSFWLELVKMVLGFLNPIVTAAAVWFSYSATQIQLQENQTKQSQIIEQVEEVKTAASSAAQKVAEVKMAVETAHQDLKSRMD